MSIKNFFSSKCKYKKKFIKSDLFFIELLISITHHVNVPQVVRNLIVFANKYLYNRTRGQSNKAKIR